VISTDYPIFFPKKAFLSYNRDKVKMNRLSILKNIVLIRTCVILSLLITLYL